MNNFSEVSTFQSIYRGKLLQIIKYIFFFFLLTTFNLTEALGQSNPDVNPLRLHTLSPAPEVGNLSKYGETPVSTYNGVPNINIDLYQIKVRDLSLPISASFHPVGQRVKEESSWLGLGWILSCGGSVSRIIRGLNDFDTRGYYKNQLKPDDPYPSDPTVSPYKYFFATKNYISNLMLYKNGVEKNYYDIFNQGYDFESDVYKVSCGNLNIQFLVDKNNKFQLIGHADVKIKYIVDQFKDMGDWEITSPDGTKYYFGDRTNLFGPYQQYAGMATDDKTHTHMFNTAETNVNTATNITSWYIRKIVSPQGEEVVFQYEKPKKVIGVGNKLTIPIPDVSQIKINGFGVSLCSPTYKPEGLININYMVYESHYMKRVNFKNGHLDFVRDTVNARKDLTGAERLAFIKVYETNSAGTEELIKEVEFNNTEYFVTNDSQKGFEEHITPAAFTEYILNFNEVNSRRLRLDGIVEKNGNTRRIYKFEYNNISLPKKTSYAVDHFGYFNGKTNFELTPGVKWKKPALIYYNSNSQTYETKIKPNDSIQGANKEPDFTYTNALNIKKVVYPLGGWTSYEFEPNQYLDQEDSNKVKAGGGVRIGRMVDYDPILNKSIIKRFKYEKGILTTPLRYFTIRYCMNVNVVMDFNFTHKFDDSAIYTTFLPNFFRYGSPVYPMSNAAGGNAVGYSKVEVWLGNDGEFGKTVYQFHNEADKTPPVDQQGFIYITGTPPGVSDVRNGNVIKQTAYAFENGAFRKITETRNRYETLYNFQWQISSLRENAPLPFSNNDFCIVRYPVSTGWSMLSYSYQTSFDINGDSISNYSQYNYSLYPVKYHLPSEKLFIKSDGLKMVTRYKYAPDYISTVNNGWIKTIDTLNIIRPIEERELTYEGLTLGARITKYHKSGQPTEVYILENNEPVSGLPFDSVNVVPPNSLFKLRANYYYDDNSNLITQKIENYLCSYIWGYKNSNAIAQANNAMPADIAYTGFEYESKGNWPVGPNSNEARTGKGAYSGSITKTGLSTSKEYIISMWSKGGTPTLSSGTLLAKNTINGWTYYEGSFTNNTSISINTNGKPIDDLRLFPIGSQMVALTIDPSGPGTITDENNVTSFFEYDDFQRLKAVRDQYGNILKAYKYNTILK